MRWSRALGALVIAACAIVAIGMANAAPAPARATSNISTTNQALGGRLPLQFRTHRARQVITVVARSQRSTVATLQAWRKLRGGGWVRRGPRIRAHIGTDGMTWHASESKSATPMGSFTLTRAFGHKRNPGTNLPYLHTNPADWWISQLGPLYNTHQRCWSHCPFIRGAPNEHLYYETPYYNYAVVIDYNTRNAPGGVRQGRGSAFFLHVTVGQPTAGCVAIPQARLVSIMRWLAPRKHPRILIGVR
jgi:L,D-peptidoglycan transpeptidase YkuD (ErfK/YbiS/YcfS/YnhG family)